MATFTVINGRYYSHASGEFVLDGVAYTGIQSIEWKAALKSKKVYGSGAKAVGRTRGQHEADGSVEMVQQCWEVFKLALAARSVSGKSYGTVEFDIFVSYSEADADPVITRTLRKCRIEEEPGGSNGTDENKVKATLSIMDIVDEAGISLLADEDA